MNYATEYACANCRTLFVADGSVPCPKCGSNVMVSTDLVRPESSQPNGGTPDVNGHIAEEDGWVARGSNRWFRTLDEALAEVATRWSPILNEARAGLRSEGGE